MLIRFSDRREARGEELAPCDSSISAAQMDSDDGITDMRDDGFSDFSDGFDDILFINAIFEHYKRQKLCTLKRRLCSTFPGDCSFSKVLYLDCVNFGSFTISEEVPRIGFWSGSVLRHCCNLDKIKDGKYGRRPLKVSGNVSVPTNLKAYLDNLYGSLLPDELKVAADAYEVPSKAEVDVACSVPNKSQIAETNPSHSFDGGLVSLHLGYHSVSNRTNDEDTKVCSTHDNNCAQQIHSNDEALNSKSGCSPLMKLSKPEDRNAPMKQNIMESLKGSESSVLLVVITILFYIETDCFSMIS
ncbi:hypothetical protein ACP4OV_019159 [Aristida adscensionis]